MTNDEILNLAREAGTDVSVWIFKFAELVAAAERQRIHEYLMRLHLDAGGKHNYLHVAANGLEDL